MSRSAVDEIFAQYSQLKKKQVDERINLLKKLEKTFLFVLQKNIMMIVNNQQEKSIAEEDDRVWYRRKYAEAKRKLLEGFHHSSKKIKELSLNILMGLLATEAKHPYFEVKGSFPLPFFQSIINEILSETESMSVLIGEFKKFIEYDDVKFNLLRMLETAVKKKQNPSQHYVQNIFGLLENITLPAETPEVDDTDEDDEEEEEDEESDDLMEYDDDRNNNDDDINAGSDDDDAGDNVAIDDDDNEDGEEMECKNLCERDGEEPFQLVYDKARKSFSSTWMGFLQLELTSALYRKVLIILPDQVLQHLENPLLLTDFLMESFRKGGIVSLLALNSLFLLINSYNLEYPDFYKELYSLFKPDILQAKNRARFFSLTDLVLQSTHLPEYLVAAFVKKLSRLALTASPNSITIIVPFIRNLLIRHPNLSLLIHRDTPIESSPDEGITDDPFIPDEPDPAKCRAMISSLWEIKSLQSHYVPEVAVSCRMVNRMLPNMETNLGDKFDGSLVEMLDREVTRSQQADKEIAVTYERPTGLFERSEDKMNSYWSIS